MRIPRSAKSLLIAIEAAVMVVVLVLCVVHPWATKPKNDVIGNRTEHVDEQQGVQENTEKSSEPVTETEKNSELEEVEVSFSPEVLAKVESMTLEQKVAQLFIITPETLTGADKVTVTGNTTKNAINQYPVGGLVYSSNNFQRQDQVKKMLTGVQEHYKAQFGIPVFLMISEQGGPDSSPVATSLQYTVEAEPSEIGDSGDAQNAINAATNISSYLKELGFNVNIAPNVEIYSKDTSIASMMVAETVSTFEQKGISSVMFTFTRDKINSDQEDLLIYKAGIDAGADCMMIAGTSKDMVRFIRSELKFGGVIISDSLAPGQAVASVISGVDMIYCPENFVEAYQKVLDAANAGAISEEILNTAVARILTCKENYE